MHCVLFQALPKDRSQQDGYLLEQNVAQETQLNLVSDDPIPSETHGWNHRLLQLEILLGRKNQLQMCRLGVAAEIYAPPTYGHATLPTKFPQRV
jgi:hypothetical protein